MENDKNRDMNNAPENNEQDTHQEKKKSQLAQDLEIVRRAARDKDLTIGDTLSGSDGGAAGDGAAA